MKSWNLGTHLPVELSPVCRLQPRSVVTRLHRGVCRMLSHRKAAAWIVVLSVWAVPLGLPLNSKLTEPGEGLWMLVLKTTGDKSQLYPTPLLAAWFVA